MSRSSLYHQQCYMKENVILSKPLPITMHSSLDILAQRFREMAYLNRGMTISLRDERTDHKATFYLRVAWSRLCAT